MVASLLRADTLFISTTVNGIHYKLSIIVQKVYVYVNPSVTCWLIPAGCYESWLQVFVFPDYTLLLIFLS